MDKTTPPKDLISENAFLRMHIRELQEKISALKLSSGSEGATRMFRLVKEKKDKLEQLTESMERLREQARVLKNRAVEFEDKLERAEGLVALFKQIFDSIPSALLCVEGTGRILYANRIADGVFKGSSPIRGRNISELFIENIELDLNDELSILLRNPSEPVRKTFRKEGRVLYLYGTVIRRGGSLLGAIMVISEYQV